MILKYIIKLLFGIDYKQSEINTEVDYSTESIADVHQELKAKIEDMQKTIDEMTLDLDRATIYTQNAQNEIDNIRKNLK